MDEGAVVLIIGAAIAGSISVLLAAVIFFSTRKRA